MSFSPILVKCIQVTNIVSMLLVHVLTSCVSVSLTRDIILPCQRLNCHKATRLAMCKGYLAEGLMEVFMHVSQLAGNNLHVMSGPRRQPTCWAAPWRSSPPPSSSTRPRAPCPEPAPSAKLLTKMAQQTQVPLHPLAPPSHSHCFHTHAFTYASAHHRREIACSGESNAYLSNEYHSFTMAIDR